MMKKLIILLLGISLLTACSANDTKDTKNTAESNGDASPDTEQAQNNENSEGNDSPVTGENFHSFPEYSTIEKQIDLTKYDLDVVEDGSHKRVILFTAQNGERDFKSIFTKKTGRLKIISFKDGVLFDDVIL